MSISYINEDFYIIHIGHNTGEYFIRIDEVNVNNH